MFGFYKYKRFEKKTLRELESLPSFNMMMAISISPEAYQEVFEKHASKLSMDYTQSINLAKKLCSYMDKTDIQTIGMLYAHFLWLFVHDEGKMLNVNEHDDPLRKSRIEYGLNNFNLWERNGFYTFAPIDYKKYGEYLKGK